MCGIVSTAGRWSSLAVGRCPFRTSGELSKNILRTRRYGGLFDISHMGRFFVSGKDTIPFLQHVLTNNVLALDPGMAQYTLIPNEKGGALDDAYVYRLDEDDSGPRSYLLVVNAGPREKDWNWLTEQKKRFPDVVIEDKTEEIGMMAFQGPGAKKVLEKILKLPDPWRNRLRVGRIDGTWVMVSRTGYTGEPICFEIFILREKLEFLWQRILSEGEKEGIVPAGLGARDSLRMEAGLVLYGNELGLDTEGKEIPIYAMLPAARVTVSFSPLKGEFIGRERSKGSVRRGECKRERLSSSAERKTSRPKEHYALSYHRAGDCQKGT